MKFLLCLLSLIVACCFANAEILFTRTAAPKGWSLGDRAKSSQSLSFMMALKQNNLDQLEERFWAVSDPDHDLYQSFMTKEEIIDLIKPSDRDFQAVLNWLHSHEIRHIRSFGDAIEIKATALQCEHLFNTVIHQFKNIESGQVIYRQFGAFSVPDSIRPYIDAVFGLSTFPVPHYSVHKNNRRVDEDFNLGVVPQTVYNLYNISYQAPAKDLTITSQGVIEFSQEYFSPSDLAAYAEMTDIDIQTVPANQIIGFNDPTQAGDEAELDLQFIASVNVQSSNWFWIEPGNNWLYDFAVHFFSTKIIPQVISISYGWYEGDQCSTDPGGCNEINADSHGYDRRVDIEFQKIGLRGVSIIVASGDSGAHTRNDSFCSASTLLADYPASSPYVTSVGATQIMNPTLLSKQPTICSSGGFQCAAAGTEVAVSFDVSKFASGGGFSEVFAQPAYQAKAVKHYLSSGIPLPPSSYFNASTRGHPDVSAIGNDNLIFNQNGNGIESTGGTSASAPIFAAVVSLLNEISMKKTGKTLGFMNPLLYKMQEEAPATFHDIVTGDNKCTEMGCFDACYGYYATKGWDPVTGLGTPNYGQMKEYLEKLLN